MAPHKIAVLPGDGVGKDVTDAAMTFEFWSVGGRRIDSYTMRTK
jgi:isocitrate/isopropylmalate dehydrogenase